MSTWPMRLAEGHGTGHGPQLPHVVDQPAAGASHEVYTAAATAGRPIRPAICSATSTLSAISLLGMSMPSILEGGPRLHLDGDPLRLALASAAGCR